MQLAKQTGTKMENPPKRKYKKHKQGYTISVNHFLRKDKSFLEKLAAKKNSSDELSFPIYIRVSFLQQTSVIKSRIKESLNENDFIEYFDRSKVKKFIDYEIAAIRLSIDELSAVDIKDFLIKQWTKYYNDSNIFIGEVVQEWATKEFYKILSNAYLNDEIPLEMENDQKAFFLNFIAQDFKYIEYLAEMNVLEAKSFKELYGPLFKIKFWEGELGEIGSFSIWDWKTGHYKAMIHDLHGENANSYIELLEKILPHYQDIMK